MLISVIICTRNRARDLRSTLESLLTPANAQAKDWELVLVDNGSEDNTREVCTDFEKRFPEHVRVRTEQTRGHSRALNTAIAAVQGDIVAFTDDDVRCAPNYLEAIRDIFLHCDADGAQGRVLPEFAGSKPAWLDGQFGMTIALRDCGDDITELDGPLFGCNMIVRATVLRRIGGFAVELGPGTSGLAADVELTQRMRKAGCRLLYAPQIVVWHRIPAARLTKAYFRQRFFVNGRSVAYIDPLPASPIRFALYLLKLSLVKETQAIWYLSIGRPAEALRCQCDVSSQAGFFWQHWLFRRGVSSRLTSKLATAVKELHSAR